MYLCRSLHNWCRYLCHEDDPEPVDENGVGPSGIHHRGGNGDNNGSFNREDDEDDFMGESNEQQ